MSLRRNPNQGKSVGRSGSQKNQNLTKRVVDVILSSDHQAYNSPEDIGTIFFVEVGFNQDYTDSTALPSAKPLNRNVFTYPNIGELVQIVESTSNDVYNDLEGDINSKINYYTPAINIHNNTSSNALPLEKDSKKLRSKREPNVKSFEFKKEFKSPSRETAKKQLDNYLVSLGYTGSNDPNAPLYNLNQTANGDYIFRLDDSQDNEQAVVKLGNYFKENPELRPLTPSEGDSIIEGKNGQRIRLTTTGPTGTNAISNNVTDAPDDGNPSIGDKAMVLSLGNDSQENITKDAASVYLLENQSIPIDVASTNVDSLNSTYSPQPKPLEELSKPPSEVIPQTLPEKELQIQQVQFDFSAAYESNPITSVSSSEVDFVEDDPVFAALDEAQEEGLINFDDESFEIAGTELDEEGQLENNAGGDLDSGGDSGINGGDPETGDEYDTDRREGEPIIFKNNNQFIKWKKEGNGKADYPLKFIFNKTKGQKEGIVDPKSITDMITKLKADGVNAANLPNIKHLVCHVTATSYTNQHDLMGLFAYTKDGNGWSRHGYNISVDSDGGCNYNVDLIEFGFSNGSGGNVYSKEIQGFGPLTNSNSINISWIGTVDMPMARTDLTKDETSFNEKTTTSPNITSKQAYAYEKLIKYFVEAFPDIKVVAHNQITITKGYGKSCPGWNNVRFCENIGIPNNNIHKLFPSDFSVSDWVNIIKPNLKENNKTSTINTIEATAKKNMGRYFQNFKSYKEKKYSKTADYLYYLTRPSEADQIS